MAINLMVIVSKLGLNVAMLIEIRRSQYYYNILKTAYMRVYVCVWVCLFTMIRLLITYVCKSSTVALLHK